MILGMSHSKIELYNNAEVLQDSYELTKIEQPELTQMYHHEDLDTAGIEVMDNGDRKKIVSGKNVEIIIPIQVVEGKTLAAWETFLYKLWDWEEKIKVTPYTDESGYAFWCLLERGRKSTRSARNYIESDTLIFIGAERVSSVS